MSHSSYELCLCVYEKTYSLKELTIFALFTATKREREREHLIIGHALTSRNHTLLFVYGPKNTMHKLWSCCRFFLTSAPNLIFSTMLVHKSKPKNNNRAQSFARSLAPKHTKNINKLSKSLEKSRTPQRIQSGCSFLFLFLGGLTIFYANKWIRVRTTQLRKGGSKYLFMRLRLRCKTIFWQTICFVLFCSCFTILDKQKSRKEKRNLDWTRLRFVMRSNM